MRVPAPDLASALGAPLHPPIVPEIVRVPLLTTTLFVAPNRKKEEPSVEPAPGQVAGAAMQFPPLVPPAPPVRVPESMLESTNVNSVALPRTNTPAPKAPPPPPPAPATE